jgi:hypothetical protein
MRPPDEQLLAGIVVTRSDLDEGLVLDRGSRARVKVAAQVANADFDLCARSECSGEFVD